MSLEILIVDDEPDICHLVRDILEDEGYQTRAVHDGPSTLEAVKKRCPHLVLLDIWLGDTQFDGLKILENLKKDHPDLPVLMMSGHGTIETAVAAIKLGAYDFLEKPFKSDRLIHLIDRMLETYKLRLENDALREKIVPSLVDDDLVGVSPAIQSVRESMSRHAHTNAQILIHGPDGSGKETIARLLHSRSARAKGPFIVLDCHGLGEASLEGELFGHETDGATHTGVFERAHLGTLYLNRVDKMPVEAQRKIARALQRQKFLRENGRQEVEANFRVLASAAHPPEVLITEGILSRDFADRIALNVIKVPALQERRDDIPLLAQHFFQFFTAAHRLEPLTLGDDLLSKFMLLDWPGNVHQLRNVIESIVLYVKNTDLSAGQDKANITGAQIPDHIFTPMSEGSTGIRVSDFLEHPLREAREKFEKHYLHMQLGRFDHNISKTADFVGMERSALHRKLRSLDVK